MEPGSGETKRLRRNVEWALRRALDPATVLPMLHRLSRLSAQGSDENLYAQRRLAELLLDHDPWRAALAARRVLAADPSDDGAWAILAACHALLGHYRCAAAAYRRALGLAPDNAAYAHNLGHLLDVALDRPRDALPWLSSAYASTGRRGDVAVSFAHALARAGELAEAQLVSRRALRSKGEHTAEHLALAKWLREGRHAEPQLVSPSPPARAVGYSWMKRGSDAGRRRRAGDNDALHVVLAKGLARLPLDRGQRARARDLARALPADLATSDDDLGTRSLAAAVAYAVAFASDVPLTQADVAACFRVSLPALRGQFKALRARLGLTLASRRAAPTTR